MSAALAGATSGRVLFFLSYAHPQRNGRRDDAPDKPVGAFYRDLSEEVARLAGLPPSAQVGFADWEIPTGRDWRHELGRVLATCGVFIALYSPDYFTSEMCGQEWAAFRRREKMHRARTQEGKAAIIPVMWKRMDDEDMHPTARRIHYLLHDAGDMYRRRGMRELVMRGNREEIRQAYRAALTALAKTIVEAANTDPLLPIDAGVLQLDPDENAFEGEWSRDDLRPLRFVVVAPVLGRLPPGANPEMYGSSPEKWRPYHPDDPTPIAQTAAALVEVDGFRPIIELLASCHDLRNGSRPSAPTIMIVDPWSAQDPELYELLRDFDEISDEKPWVRLVIPWNKDRSGGGHQVDELEKGLRMVLDRTRSQCRLKNPEAVAGLPTVAAFGERLPGVIAAAERGYFLRTTTFPPGGGGPGMPRFGTGPGNGNDTGGGNPDV